MKYLQEAGDSLENIVSCVKSLGNFPMQNDNLFNKEPGPWSCYTAKVSCKG